MKRITAAADFLNQHALAVRLSIVLTFAAMTGLGLMDPADASMVGVALIFGNENFVKTYKAGAQILPYTIVKWDAVDFQVLPAAAVGDKMIGVSVPNITVPNGQRVDVVKGGIAQVVLGGAVTRGDPITSNATGQGVLAAPGAGVNNRIVGYAEMSGVANDIIPVMINPDTIQG